MKKKRATKLVIFLVIGLFLVIGYFIGFLNTLLAAVLISIPLLFLLMCYLSVKRFISKQKVPKTKTEKKEIKGKTEIVKTKAHHFSYTKLVIFLIIGLFLVVSYFRGFINTFFDAILIAIPLLFLLLCCLSIKRFISKRRIAKPEVEKKEIKEIKFKVKAKGIETALQRIEEYKKIRKQRIGLTLLGIFFLILVIFLYKTQIEKFSYPNYQPSSYETTKHAPSTSYEETTEPIVTEETTQECFSHAKEGCYDGDAYWFDSCNNKEELIADCDANCLESEGYAYCCGTHVSEKCYEGDVYWFDGCGNREELAGDCGYDCFEEEGSAFCYGSREDYCKWNYCQEECVPRDSKRCYGNNLYWFDSCGNPEELDEYCGSDKECVEDECVTTSCVSHYSKKCVYDTVYWYDSCDRQEGVANICLTDYKCSNGECVKAVEICGSHSFKDCFNGDIWWYDSCGHKEGVYKYCAYNEYCYNSKCLPKKITECQPDYRHECSQDFENAINVIDIYDSCGKKTGYIYCPLAYGCENGGCVNIKIFPSDPTVINKLNELTQGNYEKENFNKNFMTVYYYVNVIPYRFDSEDKSLLEAISGVAKIGDGRYGGDYMQTAEETVKEGYGDCEDHAILLQTLLEALFIKTYGYIPEDTLYIVCGSIIGGGGHCWNVIDKTKLPKGNSPLLSLMPPEESVKIPNEKMLIIIDDVSFPEMPVEKPRFVEYNPMGGQIPTLLVARLTGGEKEYVELEATWGMPHNWYNDREYPYEHIYAAVNSQEYLTELDFYKKEKKEFAFMKYINWVDLAITKFWAHLFGLISPQGIS